MTTAHSVHVHARMPSSSNVTSVSNNVNVLNASAPGSHQSSQHVRKRFRSSSVDGPCNDALSESNGRNNGANNTQVTAQVVVSSSTSNGNSLVPSPQFITVATVNETEGSRADSVNQAVHSTYVHYVDGGTSDPNIYTATNDPMAYPVYTVGDTMYSPATGTYYSNNNTLTYTQVGTGEALSAQSQILAQSGGSAYLIQSTMEGDGHQILNSARNSPQTDQQVAYVVPENAQSDESAGTIDSEGQHGISHATRVSPATVNILSPATRMNFPSLKTEPNDNHVMSPNCFSIAARSSPATVQWLIDNYETAEGVSLPRSTLYNHYLRHCAEHKLDPVNAASFGKLIRSVFLGLRTRRLGTRGNSKYHYYGIRVKPNSPLNQISDEINSAMAIRQQASNNQKRFKLTSSGTKTIEATYDNNSHGSSNSVENIPQNSNHQFLGDINSVLPRFPQIHCDNLSLPDGLLLDDLDHFRSMYQEHCQNMLELVIKLQFNSVETLWQQFWRSTQHGLPLEPDAELKCLSNSKFYLICSCKSVQSFVKVVDYQFYQNLVEVLIPDVLRPIPSSLTQAIRNFAKGLETWLTSAMTECPDDMLKIKLSAVSAFAQTLRRYTSLNHLAQAARAVLQNSSQISQMLSDLNRVDFHNVQEQASWVCQCEDGMVQKLERDFKQTLQQQNSLEQWASWLENVVREVLKPHDGKPDYPKAARQFLLKWSFYSSMVIRDLTLRSAASFGSFHLIRLLYDEYMFYLIEHRVAAAVGKTPIAVMGEHFICHPVSSSLELV